MQDILFIINWWALIFLMGIIFLPLTIKIFSSFFDKGYIFSKILALAFISYFVFILGLLRILPFSSLTIFLVLGVFLIFNLFLIFKDPQTLNILKKSWKIFLLEEFLFFTTLFFWSYIRGFQPDIHGLEKYMDFGFVNSILKSDYFPPKDIWFTPLSINYYYFGHLITAVLTKLSNIPSSITFNLMLGTIFAFTFVGGFSIGLNLLEKIKKGGIIIGGFLTAFVLTFGGNLQTIYTFFVPYQNENPVPFWQLLFSPSTFPNSYWYPNATRFIYNTIHEFPIYSFVVSDLHGHVLDIPIVLLIIAVIFSLISNIEYRNPKRKTSFGHSIFKNLNLFRASGFGFRILLIAFLLAVMYMTNVWDGLIYALLTLIIFAYLAYRSKNYLLFTIYYLLLIAGAIIISIPFSFNFKPFVSGIGILCAPKLLTNLNRFGPFLFEADHCQRTPIWQLITLYGFFYFWAVSFIVLLKKTKKILDSDIFIIFLIILSTLLILVPEFIYAKDIYASHYRANTMFKLVYQSCIMLSLACGYIIIRLTPTIKNKILDGDIKSKIPTICYALFAISLFFLVSIYPYFSINSYYGNFQTYRGLDGISYLKTLYPNDYEAILWINKNIEGQPVILEAQGDSYTDYARISANTGLPTVLGWTVHEWLWRGTYDVPAPRISEIEMLYKTKNTGTAKMLIKKYNISLIFIGNLEHEKYPDLNEDKFKTLGTLIFQNGQTRIYRIN